MEFTYENALQWFEAYYKDVDRSQEISTRFRISKSISPPILNS